MACLDSRVTFSSHNDTKPFRKRNHSDSVKPAEPVDSNLDLKNLETGV